MTDISVWHIWGISTSFPVLSPSLRQITYVLLTRPPLMYLRRDLIVRLACIKHTASVRPEPGSNSPLSIYIFNKIIYIINSFA